MGARLKRWLLWRLAAWFIQKPRKLRTPFGGERELPYDGRVKIEPYLASFLASSPEARSLPDRSVKLLLAIVSVSTQQAYLYGYADALIDKESAGVA